MRFAKELLLDDLKVNKQELFKKAADKLCKEGFVKDSYLSALTNREKVFPTGLQTKTIGVAIPHCDPENVKKDGILVARLKQPVQFNQMGDAETKVNVYLAFFICSTGGNEQLADLRELMKMFQDKDFLTTVYKSENLFKTLLSWKE